MNFLKCFFGFLSIYVGMLLSQPLYGQVFNSEFPLDSAKQIVFLGNSITYDGQYVAMIEASLLNHGFTLSADIINIGLPSETVSGLSEDNHANGEFPRPWLFDRFEGLAEKLRPDIVFACYGMNDGIYMPFDTLRFKAYQRGMERLHEQLLLIGTKRIVFLTPPVHDDNVLGLAGYNQVLDRYSEWLIQQREKRGWEVIDLHFPMKEHLEARKKIKPEYRLAADGIHPGQEGHWLMARAVINHFNSEFPKGLSWEQYISTDAKLGELYEYVRKRHDLMRQAWLTYTGHNRPGLPQGLSMEQAGLQNEILKKQISALIHNTE